MNRNRVIIIYAQGLLCKTNILINKHNFKLNHKLISKLIMSILSRWENRCFEELILEKNHLVINVFKFFNINKKLCFYLRQNILVSYFCWIYFFKIDNDYAESAVLRCFRSSEIF